MKNLSESTNGNIKLVTTIRECLPNKCKQRDNKFGVTWCVKCGKLFTTPCGKDLQTSDVVVYDYIYTNHKNLTLK